ncbi:MAG: hypothetical protein GY704_07655, partial [Phycisphaeraceae bacterium]|nr:hypothetical protein [Phycisphaeraceae bacterium]
RALRLVWKAVKGTIDFREVCGPGHRRKVLRIVLGLLFGRKAKHLLRRHTRLQGILRIVVLPFEEPRTVDSAKLHRCPAAFAYEDPDTREVLTMPTCAWIIYKDDVMRRIMENYPSEEPAAD